MNSILKIIILLVLILIIFHYRKYKNYNKDYQIEQQELEYIVGNNIYNILNPLIITFIEKGSLKYNVDEYKLFSSITISKKFNNIITNNNYYRHTNELLLIRSKTEIKIELVNPKYYKFFKKNDKKSLLSNLTLDKANFEKVQSIDLIVREYNIIYVPRFWLFKFNKKDVTIEIFSSNNIFTYCFNYLY